MYDVRCKREPQNLKAAFKPCAETKLVWLCHGEAGSTEGQNAEHSEIFNKNLKNTFVLVETLSLML